MTFTLNLLKKFSNLDAKWLLLVMLFILYSYKEATCQNIILVQIVRQFKITFNYYYLSETNFNDLRHLLNLKIKCLISVAYPAPKI